jgi:hypothetical protein
MLILSAITSLAINISPPRKIPTTVSIQLDHKPTSQSFHITFTPDLPTKRAKTASKKETEWNPLAFLPIQDDPIRSRTRHPLPQE